jgi:hypothetical protein
VALSARDHSPQHGQGDCTTSRSLEANSLPTLFITAEFARGNTGVRGERDLR